jgi:hypothetical protein
MTAPYDPYRPDIRNQPGGPVQPLPEQRYYQQPQHGQGYNQPPPGQGYNQPGPPQGYNPPQAYTQQPPPRRKRRIFLWVFLAIQVLFILWLVIGLATVHTAPTTAQLAQACNNHNWYPVFTSQADCVTHYGGALNAAGTAGKAIGAGLVVLFWVVVDFFLGVGYGIYKLASR